MLGRLISLLRLEINCILKVVDVLYLLMQKNTFCLFLHCNGINKINFVCNIIILLSEKKK